MTFMLSTLSPSKNILSFSCKYILIHMTSNCVTRSTSYQVQLVVFISLVELLTLFSNSLFDHLIL